MRTLNKYRMRLVATALAIGSLVGLDACKQNEAVFDRSSASARVGGPDFMFYALADGNQLLQLNTANPGTVISTVGITGLQSGDRIISMDFRPATGQLYGVSNSSRLYVINQLTGVARVIGGGPFSTMIMSDGAAFDFNPTVDRIRLVTNSGQNFRLNPETGTIAATDGNINGAAGAVVTGAAYTNNKSGVTTTTLYVIDPINDRLYIQNPPNNGTLVSVGPLGVNIAGSSGFDISSDGTSALASLNVAGRTELHQIDLATGRADKVGDLPNGIYALAIPTEAVAYAIDGFNNLLIFNPLNPGTPISKPLTGIPSGVNIYGIDFRPVNGQLYAVGSNSQIYTIYTSTGAATAVGTPFTPALSGTDVGFDFNPTVDRIRVVTNTGQNLRLNPETGATAAIDLAINPSNLIPTGAAYTNNFAGATTTVLYDIDISSGQLVRQDPPNNGTLVPVGSLGISVEGANGFDITGTTGTAYALFRLSRLTNPSGQSRVYSINLATGLATPVADFPVSIRAMAVGLGF